MRTVFFVVASLVMGVAAEAMPIAPLSSAADDASVLHVQMSNQKMSGMGNKKMTCKQMMQMHRDMMGNRKMTCKQMMRMHQEMMGKKM